MSKEYVEERAFLSSIWVFPSKVNRDEQAKLQDRHDNAHYDDDEITSLVKGQQVPEVAILVLLFVLLLYNIVLPAELHFIIVSALFLKARSNVCLHGIRSENIILADISLVKHSLLHRYF